jgi:L-alanine-DL-glutamate epimerase-like enolase superfamily enzyme
MPVIAKIEYFRVPPRWLFVKITDDAGLVGWGEASLEGHTQAVEGCLDAYIERYTGMDAEHVPIFFSFFQISLTIEVILNIYGKRLGDLDFIEAVLYL